MTDTHTPSTGDRGRQDQTAAPKTPAPGTPIKPGHGMTPERIEQDPPDGRGDGKAPDTK